MNRRIENLGDYYRVAQDLQNAGGSRCVLYAQVSLRAVAVAAPFLLAAGAGIGLAAERLCHARRNRRERLKQELDEAYCEE